jgi:hypothetical protein
MALLTFLAVWRFRVVGRVCYPKLKIPIEISPLKTVAFSLWRQVLNPQQTARVLLIVFMCVTCWLWGLWIGHGDILMYIDFVFPDYPAGLLLGVKQSAWQP